jgi:hypothetical protein
LTPAGSASVGAVEEGAKAMMRTMRILSILAFGSFLAGCFNNVQSVKPELYSSLPESVREQSANVIHDREAKLRVVEGKLAKARTDMEEIDLKIEDASRDVAVKLADLDERRAALRGLRKSNAGKYEIDELVGEVEVAKHRLRLARQIKRYRSRQLAKSKQEIQVLEVRRNVLASQIELKKIRSVHEYTNFELPKAEIEVASFEEQVRRYQMKESRAKHRLSRKEILTAREKHKIHLLQKRLPEPASRDPQLVRDLDEINPKSENQSALVSQR